MKRSLLMLGLLGLVSSATVWAKPNRVLVVLSGVDYVSLKGGGRHPTGYFLTELATPLRAVLKAGHRVDFATPGGRAPVMDKVSDDVRWFPNQAEYQELRALVRAQTGLSHPLNLTTLSARSLKQFDAVFLPGGHAPMEDLVKDPQLGRLLRYFHRAGKPTALICHAPVALLSAAVGSSWPYTGYKMTVFSNAEEKQEEQAGHLGGDLTYYVQDALAAAGGKVSVAAPWTSNVVVDRELITGQNPMSDRAFAAALVKALEN